MLNNRVGLSLALCLCSVLGPLLPTTGFACTGDEPRVGANVDVLLSGEDSRGKWVKVVAENLRVVGIQQLLADGSYDLKLPVDDTARGLVTIPIDGPCFKGRFQLQGAKQTVEHIVEARNLGGLSLSMSTGSNGPVSAKAEKGAQEKKKPYAKFAVDGNN